MLGGCAFNSGLKVQVQVYSGEDLIPIEYVPDLRGALIVSGRILTQSEQVAAQLERASKEGEEIINAMAGVIKGSAALFAELSTSVEYQPSAKAILMQAKLAARDVNTLINASKLKDRTELAAALLKMRKERGDVW